jgi:ATP-dependent helicase/nuclease subunit B
MGSSDNNQIDMGNALEAGSQGSLILTVNRRLSLEIRSQYNRDQLARGRQVWESVNTISWSDWMQGLFQDLIDLGLSDLILLTQQQSNMLWERIIRHSDRDNAILRPASVARMANDAWGLMHAWGISAQQLSSAATSETERFLYWAEEFRGNCRRNKWIEQALLPDLIAQGLSEGYLNTPEEILLAGFDEITPQQQKMFDLLQDMGCKISYLLPGDHQGSVWRLQAVDITQELETAAGWAINRLQQNSGARIGIIIPQLDRLRTRVETIFRRCFDPMSIMPDAGDVQQAYNISLGVPLTQCPLVVDAFLILRFASGELTSDDLSRLLRSPFILGGADKKELKARLDAYLRSRVGERIISLDTLIRRCREFSRYAEGDDNACNILLAALEDFRRRLDHIPPMQSPQQWTDEFHALLNTLGWGRYDHMRSDEYQQLERFNQAMTSLQMLGQVQPTLELHDAIGRLHTIAQETLFHLQGGSNAPVQIVGILEAAGLEFDHLWVIGLSDDRWPAPASPNPLLPISIQRKFDLPHSSSQRELAYSKVITQRLLASAKEVVVSHAETDGENQLRVSPLVVHLPTLTLDDLVVTSVVDIRRFGFGSADLEEVMDNQAPTLPAGTHLTGGSGLLADQSACPFRAFANHRLGARAVEDPVSGVDARVRGIMTHRILQALWQQLKNKEGLLRMDDSKLAQLVSDVVDSELTRIKAMRPDTFAPRFIEIEQQRVARLIMDWLELERQRAPFLAVALEQRDRVNLAGLELDVVADRIDQLEDGSNIIIDYKTGKAIPYSGWFEQRIEEPQLPLYATTNSSDISGVFLAVVNSVNLGFKGVAEHADVVPGVKAFSDTKDAVDYDGWDGLKADWKQRLELLAREILQGRADVLPKDRNKDCLYCPLPALCRIHEWEDVDMPGEQ